MPDGWRHHAPTMKSVRAVACLEAAKGALVLIAATGLLSLVHENLLAIAAALIEHAHLNPAAKYPQIFLDAASRLQDTRLSLLAAGAALYSAARFIEAYGLLHERAWAEVLAAASGAIYVPFEILGLLHHPGWPGAILLALNVAIVAIMLQALHDRRTRRPAPRAETQKMPR